MPVYKFEARQRAVDLFLGLRIDRAAAAIVNATTAYFTITGGPILLTGLIGTVTVASGANLCSWLAEPTDGADVPICADLDINPAVLGAHLTITGVGNAAMTYNASATGLPMLATRQVIPIGDLSFVAAATDGSSSWTMFYVPLTEAAYVEAA